MVDLAKIDTIIFDLGEVIVDLDPAAVINQFGKYSPVEATAEMKELIVNSPELILYETGKITEEEFLVKMNKLLNSQMTMEQFEAAWNLMLKHIPQRRLNLMKSLGKTHQTMILSNTNGIHQRKFDQMIGEATNEVGMHSFVEIAHYSHVIGLRKPEPECYNYVIDHSQLKPEKTLFLDDNPHNIKAAKLLGIQAVQVEFPDQIFEIIGHG